MTEPSEERVEAGMRVIDAWLEDDTVPDQRVAITAILAAADAVDTRDTRIASLEAEVAETAENNVHLRGALVAAEADVDRLRAVVDPSPLWEEGEPFDAHNESLRCGTAARLLDLGHLVEAAGTLYGVQSRIAQAALTPTTDTEDVK